VVDRNAAPGFRLLCALAVRAPFDRVILPAFANPNVQVDIFWGPTTVIQDKLAQGDPADAVLITSEAVDGLIADGTLDPMTRVEIVRSQLGVAVPPGQPHPDLSTADSFRQALLDARSVAFSRGGASGIYFAGLIERLGIAEAIRAKATIIPAGFTAEKLLTGEADLAIQQISELMVVTGVDIVGPFPAAVQSIMRFSAAIRTGSAARAQAQAFLATLASPASAEAFRACGLDPIA
jgi:molybdate transport system substrate-binding protein